MQYAQHFQVHQSTSNAENWKDLKQLELEAVQLVSGELSVEALHWLFLHIIKPHCPEYCSSGYWWYASSIAEQS